VLLEAQVGALAIFSLINEYLIMTANDVDLIAHFRNFETSLVTCFVR